MTSRAPRPFPAHAAIPFDPSLVKPPELVATPTCLATPTLILRAPPAGSTCTGLPDLTLLAGLVFDYDVHCVVDDEEICGGLLLLKIRIAVPVQEGAEHSSAVDRAMIYPLWQVGPNHHVI